MKHENCGGTRRHPPGVGCAECLMGISPGAQHALSSMARVPELESAIEAALNELGVPGPGYPANVANAVDILKGVME